jgi:16S rRNA G966 N2-methylase RsmD
MRIVAGRFRGRTLHAPPDQSIRPTSDRVRESLFNLLAHAAYAIDLEGVAVIDLFAGRARLGSRRCHAAPATACSSRRMQPRAASSATIAMASALAA